MEDTAPAATQKARKTGSRIDVWEGRCEKTSGGLRKDDLVFNEKSQKICTKSEIERGKRLAEAMHSLKNSGSSQFVSL